MRVKSKSKEKKSKRSEEEKLNVDVVAPEQKLHINRSLGSEDTVQLKRDVKSINKKMEKDGEVQFFERLPQKILELTEYMKVRFVLSVSYRHSRSSSYHFRRYARISQLTSMCWPINRSEKKRS